MMGMLAVFHMRDSGGTQRQELDEILGEHQVQGPIQHDAELLFEPWQLAQVNGPPQPPGHEAGEVYSQDISYPCALANSGQLPQSLKNERFFLPPTQCHSNVARQRLALAQGVLRRRRIVRT